MSGANHLPKNSSGGLMFPIVHSLVGWFLAFAIIVGAAVAIKIILEWSRRDG